jgi:iron(III) transport system permease protein
MHPIRVKQVKEIIVVTDAVAASRRLYRETLGLANRWLSNLHRVVNRLQTEHGITLGRYVRFFTTPRSYTILLETLAISGLATVGSVILSVPLAYVIRRYERTRAFLRVLITTPLAVPVLISAYALTLFFAEHGLFNYLVVHVLHLSPQPLAISYTWPGLILACVWRFFPYTALVVAGALEGLDRSIEEAAYSTGARPHQVFLRISLPLLTPAIVTGSVLTFIGAFGTFSIPLVMGRGQDVLSVVAYRAASSFDWGSAATIVVIMAVVQLGVLAMYTRAFRRRT